MAYWDKQDAIYLAIFIIGFMLLGLLAAQKIIAGNVTLVATISLVLLVAFNPLFKERLARDFQSHFSKGVRDYWAEIVKEMQETSGKFDFHYNFNLPQTYMPEHKFELFERGLVLYEINKDELVLGYGDEYSVSQGRQRPKYLTIVYHVQRQKIIGSPPLSLNDTVEFIKKNKEFFSDQDTIPIFPLTTKETSYAQPINVKRPKVET